MRPPNTLSRRIEHRRAPAPTGETVRLSVDDNQDNNGSSSVGAADRTDSLPTNPSIGRLSSEDPTPSSSSFSSANTMDNIHRDLLPDDNEPPPYAGEDPAPQVQPTLLVRRSLSDTREQISANIRILKLCPSTEIITTRMSRHQLNSFPLNRMLRPEVDGPPAGFAPSDRDLLRFAMIVSRGKAGSMEIVLRSRPCVTMEDAMDSLLERIEILVLQVLMRHGKTMVQGGACCSACAGMFGRAQEGKFAPNSAAPASPFFPVVVNR